MILEERVVLSERDVTALKGNIKNQVNIFYHSICLLILF